MWCSGAVGAENDLGASGDDETGDGFIVQVITRVFTVYCGACGYFGVRWCLSCR